jgi:mycothiol synthase
MSGANTREPTGEKPAEQLWMLCPARLLQSPPAPQLPDGYELRCYAEADEAAYCALMAAAGFENWHHERLEQVKATILRDGFFVIVHRATGKLAATAMTHHNPTPRLPYAGELGWVAADSGHAGRGLGLAVCSAVVCRFAHAGYKTVYLKSDDFRLPAIKTYLKLGFQPFLWTPDAEARWRRVCETLRMPLLPGPEQGRKEP